MFLSQLKGENQKEVIRDFETLPDCDLPEKAVYDEIETENIILLFNRATDCFWEISVSSWKKGLYSKAEKMDNICRMRYYVRVNLSR